MEAGWMGTLIFLAELLGVAAFSVSGALLGVERRLDLFGIVLLGVTTSVGGGALRDIVLGSFPPMMFRNPIYTFLAFLFSLLVFFVVWRTGGYDEIQKSKISGIINLFDAIGLGIFSVTGVSTAISAGYLDNAFLCVFVGTLTGIGGGILRDMMSGAIPAVLHKHIYAVAAIAGAMSYYWLLRFGVPDFVAVPVGVVLTLGIRLLAARFRWSLPKATYEQRAEQARWRAIWKEEEKR
jgi:uncharacterized membrane protein YeiH